MSFIMSMINELCTCMLKLVIFLYYTDVTNEEDINNTLKEVSKAVGEDGLTLLINNAAIASLTVRKLEDVTPEVMMELYHTNAIGPLMMAKVGY